MPDLAPAIRLLERRADHLEQQLARRAIYPLIVANSLPLHASMEREYEACLSALRILRGDVGQPPPACREDCLLCDVPCD